MRRLDYCKSFSSEDRESLDTLLKNYEARGVSQEVVALLVLPKRMREWWSGVNSDIFPMVEVSWVVFVIVRWACDLSLGV